MKLTTLTHGACFYFYLRYILEHRSRRETIMRFGFHTHGRGYERGDHHGHGRHGMRGGFGERGPRGFGWGMDGEERGGGGRRRVFDGGELRLVLLRLIGDQPRHGYDLIRAIEERTGGAYAPSPGVVYPTLTMLGDMGQIEEAPSEGNRKIFAVTEEGTRVLAEKADEIAALMARLDTLGAMRERTENMSVRRAIHNLRAVLANKLVGHRIGGAELAPETLHEIVALIDEAARKIERL
jgi:DNA-binding PadR family transcriptional regulator